jgi:hypothetical protein
MLDQGIVL